MKEINKVKLFYALMCLAGFLIILLPVGIANIVFGYILKDSPCTLCWGQREAMIFIGVMALFIVRYGMKARYVAMILIMSAFGLWQSFAHFGNHAMRDLDQGFGITIFGLHTYFWAEVVFWAVVLCLGIIFFFAPKFSAFDEEMNGKQIREFGSITKKAFIISAIIIASNLFQALFSTGIPPYYGQGDPIRFTLNPKYIIWDKTQDDNHFKTISFLGKRDVKAPDYAFEPAKENLGIKFDNDYLAAPLNVDEILKVSNKQELNFEKPINSLSIINAEFVASSKYDVYFMNDNFEIINNFEIYPHFSVSITPIIGVVPFKENKFLLMGSNKSYLRFAKNDNADEVLQYADFVKGNDKFEGQGDGLGRGRIDTVRAKFHHIASTTTDGKYIYTATVPNNKNSKNLIISKILTDDMVLSEEFQPTANLKDGKTLGDLYITDLKYENGVLYALSKNHNVIVIIDLKEQKITKTIGFDNQIKNARSFYFKDGKMHILSYQDGKNIVFTLE